MLPLVTDRGASSFNYVDASVVQQVALCREIIKFSVSLCDALGQWSVTFFLLGVTDF